MAAPLFPRDRSGERIQALAQDGANASITIAPSGSSVQSTAVTASVVRIVATAAVSLEFGTNPTAVLATSLYLPANTVEYYKWTTGDKVAAIGTANVYISPMA